MFIPPNKVRKMEFDITWATTTIYEQPSIKLNLDCAKNVTIRAIPCSIYSMQSCKSHHKHSSSYIFCNSNIYVIMIYSWCILKGPLKYALVYVNCETLWLSLDCPPKTTRSLWETSALLISLSSFCSSHCKVPQIRPTSVNFSRSVYIFVESRKLGTTCTVHMV